MPWQNSAIRITSVADYEFGGRRAELAHFLNEHGIKPGEVLVVGTKAGGNSETFNLLLHTDRDVPKAVNLDLRSTEDRNRAEKTRDFVASW